MTSNSVSHARRALIGAGAIATVSPLRLARAAETPLSFQLSWIKSIQYGGYFAGIETGAFTRNKLAMTFNSGGPNVDPVANVASGQSQLGDRPIGPLIIAREKGIPIKVIATVFQRSPFSIISLDSKPIRSVRELEGKTVAVATSNRPLMQNLIRDAGLDPARVNMVPSSPDPSALVSGQIDAYSGYSTNQGVMLETRGVKIFSLNAHDLGMPETAGTIYGREDFLAANRDTVVRFLKGAVAGWQWALSNKDQTAKLMVVCTLVRVSMIATKATATSSSPIIFARLFSPRFRSLATLSQSSNSPTRPAPAIATMLAMPVQVNTPS